MKFNPLSRRMFLQGLGGYALSIPLLPSLLPKAFADTASPLRLSVVHSPLGRDVTTWYPTLQDAQMTRVDGAYYKALSEISGNISYSFGSDFNAIRSKLLILRGLDSMNSTGGHNQSLITTGSSDDPSSSEGFGYSIDAVLEESKKFYALPAVTGGLRVAPHPNLPYTWANLSYSSRALKGQAMPIEWNAQTVYNKLLNPNNVQKTAAKNAQILGASSLVTENFKQTMNSRRISAEDKIRLDNYLQLISEIDQTLAVKPIACGIATDPGMGSVPTDMHKAMFKMEAAALACGVTKIAMHGIIHCDEILNDESWHGHAHGGTNDKSSSGYSYQAEYSKWTMGLVAYYLNLLNSIQDGNGTLLDNTLFIYGNEDSNGGHQHYDLPIVMAGAKNKLRTGYLVDYRPRPLVAIDPGNPLQVLFAGRPYNSVLVTALKSFGLTPSDYEKDGLNGFGRYHKYRTDLASHYKPFIGATINDPLPFIYL